MKQKNILLFLLIILIFISSSVLTGCSSGLVGVYVETSPTKSVYAVNDTIDLSGIKVKGINADGTTKRVRVKEKHIENDVDMLTKGEKTVVLNIDGNRTSFTVYIPHYELSPKDNLKEVVNSATDGEIIYLKQGNYENTEDNLEKYKDIIVNKSLIFIGDKGKTNFSGNFVLGVENLENRKEIELNKVEFYNINFNLRYSINNNLITYEKPYFNNIVAAIDGGSAKGVYVKNCEFSGYSYAVKMNNAKNLSVIKNIFKDIKITALKTDKSTNNTTVYKNVFMDICENTLYTQENGEQNYMAAIDFSFNNEENAGVIISNNSFTRIGLKNNEFECVNEVSKNFIQNNNLQKLSYVNNTAIIILRSSNGSNLKSRGIILSFNSFGTTLNNIIFGTQEDDFLNESALIINNN